MTTTLIHAPFFSHSLDITLEQYEAHSDKLAAQYAQEEYETYDEHVYINHVPLTLVFPMSQQEQDACHREGTPLLYRRGYDYITY